MNMPRLSPAGLFWIAYLAMVTAGLTWGFW